MGGRIFAADILSNIQHVRCRLSSFKLLVFKLHLNVGPLLKRFCRSWLALFSCFIGIAKCAVRLPSLAGFTDTYCSFCVDPLSEMAAASSLTVGGCFLRLLPPKSVDEKICRWSGRLYARLFAVLLSLLTLTVNVARSESERAYAGWRRGRKNWRGRYDKDNRIHGRFIKMPFVRFVESFPYE